MPRKGKDDDPWERLRELSEAFFFAAAADRERSEDLDNMRFILSALGNYPKFRKITNASARAFVSKKHGLPKLTLKRQAQCFLENVANAIERSAYPPRVAAWILIDLPLYPKLYSRARALGGKVGSPWDDGFRAAVELVAEKIAPLLDDPDDVDYEAVVRAAMRALDADPAWVKDMFQE